MNAKALIVDDNHKNVMVLSRLLAKEGLDSIQITDPAQIESSLSQIRDVRVVFLDLEMPEMDGYEVLQTLRADTRFDAIPIVAYTVHVSEIKVAHERGFDGFIGKPLDLEDFPDQLQRILNGDPVWET